jgi:periplasmic mercuric ion binding protein
MKNIQKFLFSTLFVATTLFLVSTQSMAQTTSKTVKIKTTAVCGMCKDRIEKGLSYEKGIKSSDLDVKTRIVTVVYDEKKTNPDKIRTAISKTGYDADEVKADKVAYEKLPGCCKSGKPCTHEGH